MRTAMRADRSPSSFAARIPLGRYFNSQLGRTICSLERRFDSDDCHGARETAPFPQAASEWHKVQSLWNERWHLGFGML